MRIVNCVILNVSCVMPFVNCGYIILLQEPAHYEFSYEVNDPDSGSDFGHEESRQEEEAKGTYFVLLPDGRKQIVEYEADEEGFKPMIRYEEAQGGYPGSQGEYSGPPQRGQGPY
jgi:hypothetical protein